MYQHQSTQLYWINSCFVYGFVSCIAKEMWIVIFLQMFIYVHMYKTNVLRKSLVFIYLSEEMSVFWYTRVLVLLTWEVLCRRVNNIWFCFLLWQPT